MHGTASGNLFGAQIKLALDVFSFAVNNGNVASRSYLFNTEILMFKSGFILSIVSTVESYGGIPGDVALQIGGDCGFTGMV